MQKIPERVYWAWFRKYLPYVGSGAHGLLNVYGTASEIFYAAKSGFGSVKGLSSEERANLRANASDEKLEKCWTSLQQNKIGIILRSDTLYPKQLLELHDPPLVLYMRGCKQALSKNGFLTIVGMREASERGREVAFRLASEFARADGCVVSGFARGIDKSAHLGAISASSHSTIAVLAGGILKENCHDKCEYEKVLGNGLFISENPPEFKLQAWSFPFRNRIMAALSQATLVVEARIKSGVQHTVTTALDLGKEVYATPGRIYDETSELPNALIRDGAKLCNSIDDVLIDYPSLIDLETNKSVKRNSKKAKTNTKNADLESSDGVKTKSVSKSKINKYAKISFTNEQALIVASIGEERVSVDEIIMSTRLETTLVLRELSMLMIGDVIELDADTNRYFLIA